MTEVSESPKARIGREIDLPVPTAVWVLGVHLLTILAPILVIVVVADHRPGQCPHEQEGDGDGRDGVPPVGEIGM